MKPASATHIDIHNAADLVDHATRLLANGSRLALIAAHHDTADHPDGPSIRIVYLFTDDQPEQHIELQLRTDPERPRIPSLARLSFPASRFEREMRDLYGVEPDDHPSPRRLVHHPHWPNGWHPMRHDADPRPELTAAEPFPFVTVDGAGVYEIPVGPVHAGLIEPGHFRFSVVGETILKMKARLWFVHKGIERLFEGCGYADAVPLAERISGDTAVGHALAYSRSVENALEITVPTQAQRIRTLLLELERLHNHTTDIGALCNDVAYGIVNAHALRIRERLLRLNERVTGHRLLRGAIFPGGAHLHTVPDPADIHQTAHDIAALVDHALNHSIVRDRFTGTAILSHQQAHDLGALGYVAKASHNHNGDVLSRFLVRATEAQTSATTIAHLATTVTTEPAVAHPIPTTNNTRRHRSGIGTADGWRGTIAHRVEIGPSGHLTRLKIVDPSFFNWPALPVALANTIVPDFPLANKSFNLSYAGNDL